MWSKDYPKCVRCGKADSKHVAKGLCQRCYNAEYRKTHAKKMAQYKLKWYMVNIKGTDRGKIARERRNYDGWRDKVIERDGYTCTRCGGRTALVVHHLDGSGRGSKEHNNSIHNLVTLCRKCHINEHRKEILAIRKAHGFRRRTLGQWARRFTVCVRCRKTTYKHAMHGYCRSCVYSYIKEQKQKER